MKIGIVSFTDGRRRVARATDATCRGFEKRLASWFTRRRHKVVIAPKVVWNYATARRAAERFNRSDIDVAVFNFCVWSYPDLTAQVANLIGADTPILQLGNINPSQPGWVAFFASAGALAEIGRPFGRVLGDIKDKAVQAEIAEFLEQHDPDERVRGMRAALMLNGQRYGEFDGPSMGMYTGHVDQSQWMEQFGVHVYHRSQLTLMQNAKAIKADRVEAGLKWLDRYCGQIHWDEKKLTPGLDGTLARQVRMYLAMKDFCKEEGIDFCGLTGQLDMTEYPDLCIGDLQEAVLNDIADWEDNPKDPIVCATECDSNGALTMQLMHLLTGTPALFADLRHYHEKLGLYDLVNSGQHAPWFAKRSSDFRRNWREVHLRPASDFYFRAGGGSVQFYARPADLVTFGRITRTAGRFQMHMFTGSFVKLAHRTEERLAKQTTYEWPHAFAKFDIPLKTLRDNYNSNHIHAIIGNHIAALTAASEVLGIEAVVLS